MAMHKTVTARKGRIARVAVPIFIFIRSQATYRHMPTGGVTSPTPMHTTTSTLNTIGSMPTAWVTGTRPA